MNDIRGLISGFFRGWVITVGVISLECFLSGLDGRVRGFYLYWGICGERVVSEVGTYFFFSFIY